MIDHKNLIQKIRNSSLANDSLWAILGNVLGKGLSLLSAIWIARILGKDIYGEFGFVTNTMIAVAIFCSFGLGYTSTKFIAENKKKKPEVLSSIIKISEITSAGFAILGTIIIFTLSDILSIKFFNQPQLASLLRLTSLYILFNTIVRTQIGILAGFNAFKGLAKVNTVTGIVSIVLNVGLAYFYGLKGVLIGAVVIQLLNYILNSVLIKKELKPYRNDKINIESNLFKNLLTFSIPVALQEAVYSVLTWLFGLLLVKYSTFAEVGLSSAALYWSALILFIPGILRNVVLTHLSENTDNYLRHNRILKITLRFNFGVTLFFSLAVFLLSNVIVNLYGENFNGLKDVLNISVFTTIFVSMSNVYAQAYMSASKNWLMLFFRFLRDSLVLILGYYLLIINNGKEGAILLAKCSLAVSILFFFIMGGFYEFKLKRKF
jgi:O-antigen/teichoic acid export membrane protein